MRRWSTLARLLPVGLGVVVIAQQVAVGITHPEMVGVIIVGLATAAGNWADRAARSSDSPSSGGEPGPAPSPPE